MKETYEPIGYRVLVRPVKVESKTASGIIIPDQAVDNEQRAQVRGEVLAVGGDAFTDSKDKVQVGDIVFYQRYNGMRVVGQDGKFDDNFLFLNDRDIAGRIKSIEGQG